MLTRRGVLAGTAGLTSILALGGCGWLTRPVTGCLNLDQITSNNTPLTIDTHAHVFNGSDLQIDAFFSNVLVPNMPELQGLGKVLQDMGWNNAPSAFAEKRALTELRRELRACDVADFREAGSPLRARFLADQARQYELGRATLQAAATSARQTADFAPLEGYDEALDYIANLEPTYDAYVSSSTVGRLVPARVEVFSIKGAIDFVLRNFQYRYTNVFDYLYKYSTGERRKIDLVVTHLIDYDWPIAGGASTRSHIDDQIDVMEEISILSNGIVHFFVPFDPMKQVAFENGLIDPPSDPDAPFLSPLDRIDRAARRGAAIGVKLYPPMGFRPIGNADLPPTFWDRPWAPRPLIDAFRTRHLGEALDGVMARFYALCKGLDLPIMAHSFPSMGPLDLELDENDPDQFKYLNEARFWRGVQPGLRVDFGHFGGGPQVFEPEADERNRVADFAALMTDQPQSHGEFFYGDVGDDDRAVRDPDTYARAVSSLYAQHPGGGGRAAVADRMMYGTDWFMLTFDGPDTVNGYFTAYQEVFDQVDALSGTRVSLADRFFGQNAARFLGLRSGGIRGRLDSFHAAHDITPPWKSKVDRL